MQISNLVAGLSELRCSHIYHKMPSKPRGRRSRLLRQALFAQGSTDIRVKIVLRNGLSGPVLPLRCEVADMSFVLKCKVECALRHLRETQGESSVGIMAAAEDIELEYHGIPLRDMTTIDRYGVDNNAEIHASYMPQPTEKQTVERHEEYSHLDALVMSEPGIPSTGTIKRLVAKYGKQCQVCWRSRWFRAEILSVYSTSILMGWLDWPDAEWPNFFIHVALAAAPNMPPAERDETWRIRWHDPADKKEKKTTRDLPIVQPRYRELPPLNWVKAFLRTYAATDESSMLRELQQTLPRELVEARQVAKMRHKCIVLGASGVGKSTLISALCAGPPPPAAPTLALDGIHAADESDAPGALRRTDGRGGRGTYWPTVGTRCSQTVVNTPGLQPMHLEAWDTSGNPRFKPLSLVFYKQAQSVILVFDVKSMASFKALGAVGGWLHEFTRLTGASPRNFPFILVGNKAEDDLMHHRQVFEEDVREWLYKDGCRMPYIETSFGGDPRTGWRHAEHVFRTVARLSHRMTENLGRHRPPETVRAPEEPEDAQYLEGASFAAGSFVKSFKRTKAGDGLAQFFTSSGAEDWAEQLGSNVRELVDNASKASEDLKLKCVRSFENAKTKILREDVVARQTDASETPALKAGRAVAAAESAQAQPGKASGKGIIPGKWGRFGFGQATPSTALTTTQKADS